MDAMALALETKGTMRLEQVMQPAIELADGFPMTASCATSCVSERPATEQYEWSAKTYYPNGRIPEIGEMFRQPNLARTLRAIVRAERASYGDEEPRDGDPRGTQPRSTRATSHGASPPRTTRPAACFTHAKTSRHSAAPSRSRRRSTFTASTSTRHSRGIRGLCSCRR